MRGLGELGLDFRAGAAPAGAGRVAGLGHETVDHAMEDDPVVEALAHEFLDPRDVLGREIRPRLDHYAPALEIEEKRVLGFGGERARRPRPHSYADRNKSRKELMHKH